MSSSPSKQTSVDETKSSVFEAAQNLKRLTSNLQKTPPLATKGQRSDSVEQQAQRQSPATPLLRKTTQELLRKKSSFDQPQQSTLERLTSSSRRISPAANEDANPASKIATPHSYERSPSMQSRSLTRSNSINPAHKDAEKSSSGERSFHTSAAQSRRVSIAPNRSPVRADDLERVLTKVDASSLPAKRNVHFPTARERRDRSLGRLPTNVGETSHIAEREVHVATRRKEARTGRSQTASRRHSIATNNLGTRAQFTRK